MLQELKAEEVVAMLVKEDECDAAGLDIDQVTSIAKGLSCNARKAQALGLTVFGDNGTGLLRYDDASAEGPLIVASLDGSFDGGDAGTYLDCDGLERSNTA